MQSTCYPRQGHVSATPLKDIKLINKYGNVKSTIDSGLNILKVTDSISQNKKEEFFRRLKPALLVQILQDTQIEILLLDVREPDEFQKCHIKGAVSYPAMNLKKSVNYFSRDILPFINKEPEKIIVIYDVDEQTVVSAGNLFFEKGVDNIFVLHRGLAGVASNYPEMIEGHYEKTAPGTALKEKNGTKSVAGSKPGSPNWIKRNKMWSGISTPIARLRRDSRSREVSVPMTPASQIFSPDKR